MPSSYITVNTSGFSIEGNTAGAETDLWKYSVPRGKALRLLRNPPIQLYAPFKDTFSGDGSQTAFNLTKNVVDVPNLSKDTIAVIGGTENTAYTIDYANDTITFDSAPANGTDNVEVYYIPAEGVTHQMFVYDTEDRQRNDRVLNKLDRGLFTADQLNRDEAVRLQREVQLVENMELALRVNASYEYSTDAIVQDRLLFVEIPVAEQSWSEWKDRADEVRRSLGRV